MFVSLPQSLLPTQMLEDQILSQLLQQHGTIGTQAFEMLPWNNQGQQYFLTWYRNGWV